METEFKLNYFINAKQQLSLNLQWVGIQAHENKFYVIDADRYRLNEISKPYSESDNSIDLDAFEDAIDDNVSMIYLCNPNNPTGKTIDGDVLRNFCRRVGRKVTVLVDEAYNELTENPKYSSMADLIKDDENIIITRTFSKLYGMAGMRIGYAMGRPDLIKKVRNHVMAWPNIVGLAAANATYEENDFIEYSLERQESRG